MLANWMCLCKVGRTFEWTFWCDQIESHSNNVNTKLYVYAREREDGDRKDCKTRTLGNYVGIHLRPQKCWSLMEEFLSKGSALEMVSTTPFHIK
jgi:hypothetical protein